MQTLNFKTLITAFFAIVLIAVLPHSGLISFFPFSFTVPILLFVWLYLKAHKESFSDIGFSFKWIAPHQIIIGSLVAILALLFLRTIFFPVLESMVAFESVDVDLYDNLRADDNKMFYIFILVMGCIVGGLYEEIVFHSFMFTLLERMLPTKYNTVLSFLLTSIIFGLYHYQLGTADAINAFLMGAVYLGLFLFYKRNLWYSIFCHSAYNSIVITLLYLGYI